MLLSSLPVGHQYGLILYSELRVASKNHDWLVQGLRRSWWSCQTSTVCRLTVRLPALRTRNCDSIQLEEQCVFQNIILCACVLYFGFICCNPLNEFQSLISRMSGDLTKERQRNKTYYRVSRDGEWPSLRLSQGCSRPLAVDYRPAHSITSGPQSKRTQTNEMPYIWPRLFLFFAPRVHSLQCSCAVFEELLLFRVLLHPTDCASFGSPFQTSTPLSLNAEQCELVPFHASERNRCSLRNLGCQHQYYLLHKINPETVTSNDTFPVLAIQGTVVQSALCWWARESATGNVVLIS